MRSAFLLGLVLASAALPLRSGGSEICSGDCDNNGRVTVAELIRGVRCALSPIPESDCAPCFSAPVSINAIIGAVGMSLRGCPGSSLPAATPTPTPERQNAVSVLTFVPYRQCEGSVPPPGRFDPTPFLDQLEAEGWTIVDYEVRIAEIVCAACGCPVSGSPTLTVWLTR
jgi:hypothetical protein